MGTVRFDSGGLSGQGTGSVLFAIGDFDDFPFLPGFQITQPTAPKSLIAITSGELPRRLHFMPLPQLESLISPSTVTGSSLIWGASTDEGRERSRLPAVGPETRWESGVRTGLQLAENKVQVGVTPQIYPRIYPI
jgi:hypothetical protein